MRDSVFWRASRCCVPSGWVLLQLQAVPAEGWRHRHRQRRLSCRLQTRLRRSHSAGALLRGHGTHHGLGTTDSTPPHWPVNTASRRVLHLVVFTRDSVAQCQYIFSFMNYGYMLVIRVQLDAWQGVGIKLHGSIILWMNCRKTMRK